MRDGKTKSVWIKRDINSKGSRLDQKWKEEQWRDESCQPLDLSRAEPAVMLLRLSFSSFWSEIKRWLKSSSGFGSRWYADCNYCVNEGIKHGIELVGGQGKKGSKSQTQQTSKILIRWRETSVGILISGALVIKLRHVRMGLMSSSVGGNQTDTGKAYLCAVFGPWWAEWNVLLQRLSHRLLPTQTLERRQTVWTTKTTIKRL